MKILLFLLVVLILRPANSYAQSKEVVFLLDTTISIVKNNAAKAAVIDWPDLRTRCMQQLADAKNAYDMGPAFRMLFRELGDFHGWINCWDSTYRWTPFRRTISDSVKNEWTKGVVPKTEMLTDQIGYLRVPGMSFGSREELNNKAQNLNDSLCSLLNKAVNGIVLDLRLNSGGAMYPMMLGLEQLLGEGLLGSFTSGDQEEWIIRDDTFLLGNNALVSIKPFCDRTDVTLPVVILTGSNTGSSGEFLAIAFKGRPNTTFVGNATAGYVTSINCFQINEAVNICLSTGYGKDRNGKVYETALAPDISIDAADSFNDLQKDAKIQAAVHLLQNR